ncbi:hypothetical protein [Sulfurospirillum arcachonense]|uniref:hypothetical protein n=1 Tax=Sulfurospirillum arcachonense TaxID=57666 RepID=UPI0004686D7D|nr:hypothetical protein [Sulfurospirillum arcachonense]
MSISLEKYIETALLEITKGVESAATKSQTPIAPANVEGVIQRDPQLIEFEIQATVTEQKTNSGNGSVEASLPLISVIKANVGGGTERASENSTAQKIKFSVPVYFQGKKSSSNR